MARRSKATAVRPGRWRLPSHPLPQTAFPDTTSQDDAVGDSVPPPRGAQVETTNRVETRRISEHKNVVWRTEIFERVVKPIPDMKMFLKTFVPSSIDTPECPDKKFARKVPMGTGREGEMYGPLITGLTRLVRQFPDTDKPTFHKHASKIMKPPYSLCDDTEHETKPDIVVTVPKLPQLPPLERWRNLALVLDVEAEASDDPMWKRTEQHETTIIQLVKSARNIMLAQGRLFAFGVGVYGHMARIFRFDRAGAVCSPLFDYVKEPQHMHEFLWRFVHPSVEGCSVVGEDPTTSLGTTEERDHVRRMAKVYDPSYEHTNEHQKTIRKFTVQDEHGEQKNYLAYKLIFVNTGLCSRASMIWEAFELDDKDNTTGVRVVIKEAWRPFGRPSEIRHYLDLQDAAASAAEDAAVFLSVFAELEYGTDLGLRETRELAKVGHAMTSDKKPFTGSVDDLDEHQLLQLTFPPEVFERGQIRMVIKTVGTPITDFKSTYEMVHCLYDAITAHKRAYQAGIIHRDVSRGNVMFRRNANGSARGFLHDSDHASNWKRFLADIQSSDSLAAWEAYTWEEYQKDVAAGQGVKDNTEGGKAKVDYVNGPLDVPDSQPQKKPSVQEKLQNAPRAPSDLADAPPTPGDAPHTPRDPKDAPQTPEKSKHEQRKKEQKQRTGTIYFMALEILDNYLKFTHEARHDLESFYWLLVWIVLRHVKCDYRYRTWHQLFDYVDLTRAYDVKKSWMWGDIERIIVSDNKPLTVLLEKFRLLCQKNANIKQSNARMTHDQVLRLFSAMLRKNTWPRNDSAIPWTKPATQPGDHPQPDGRSRTTGTLAFSLNTQEEAVTGVVPDDALPASRGTGEAASDAGDLRDEGHAKPESDAVIEDEPLKRGKGPARKTVARRPRARAVAPTTSANMSKASGTHQAPQGSKSVQVEVEARYNLRSATKEELPRRPARNGTHSMGPPPVPATRSGASRDQSRRLRAAPQGSRATKRSHPRGDDEAEDEGSGAGMPHPPKRQKTLSQRGPDNLDSRRAKGKKRAL
ncbi:hypothetical protein C8Q72DRAFT_951625 [Fomitopsis betulina]|nr:hypothetical protein C8Q72DRAFT_951625 [Fomitopsis betulina]